MKGVTLVILIAIIAFVIAVVALGIEFFQTMEIETHIFNFHLNSPVNSFLNY